MPSAANMKSSVGSTAEGHEQNAALSDDAIELGNDIYDLLSRKGDLCIAQISVELGVQSAQVCPVLSLLEEQGLIAKHPDRDKKREWVAEQVPWGLSRFRPSVASLK